MRFPLPSEHVSIFSITAFDETGFKNWPTALFFNPRFPTPFLAFRQEVCVWTLTKLWHLCCSHHNVMFLSIPISSQPNTFASHYE